MSIYRVLVFLHVAGGVGMFVALGIETVSLGRLRRAQTPSDARTWMGLLRLPARIGPVSILTNLATGVWMMVLLWGPQPWIQAAFLAVVGIAVTGAVASRRGMRALGQALPAETGPRLSAEFRSLLSRTPLVMSLWLRAALGTGILGLMTIKPGVTGSLVSLAAALVVGLAAGIRSIATRPVAAEPDEALEHRVGHEERAAV
jgi:hypothetical protein